MTPRRLHRLSVSAEFQPASGEGPITREITLIGDMWDPDENVGQMVHISFDSTMTPPTYDFEELPTITHEETEILIRELDRLLMTIQKCNGARPK